MGAPLAARFDGDDRRPTVTAFPDGSVDRFYEVFDGDSRIGERASFARRINAERTTGFTLRPSAVEPGGHAVNMADQADRLGNDVTLVGHLDDPTFAELSFETLSMGEPSRVSIYDFDDGDVLAIDSSTDIEEWSLAALREATGAAFEPLLSADVVFCTNWSSVHALPEALAELSAADLDGGYFVFDPGRLADRSATEVLRLIDALTDLTESYDVVVAANGTEVRSLAEHLADDNREPDDVGSALERLRAAAELDAAVVHETEAAVAALPGERVRVENFDVEAVRHTGGGDRFDAGLAHALARDWSWEDALRVGNACASRYVATGESATTTELGEFLREHE